MIFIRGKKIELRIEEHDEFTKDFVDLLNDSNISEGSQLHRMPIITPKKNDGHNLICAICTDVGGKPSVVGRVSLEDINHINQSAELKVFIKVGHTGKGYAKEACTLLINHAFKALNLQRIYSGTLENNTGFKSLASSLKFENEGIRRKAAYKGGKFLDVIEYGLLKEDKHDESRQDQGKV
jgi:ribosomal-protein-alanine N-acetyltransferase